MEIMNVLECSSEASGYYKQTNGTPVFYFLPHDAEIAFRKGQTKTYVLAEIWQHCASNLCDRNDATLNAVSKEHMTK